MYRKIYIYIYLCVCFSLSMKLDVLKLFSACRWLVLSREQIETIFRVGGNLFLQQTWAAINL